MRSIILILCRIMLLEFQDQAKQKKIKPDTTCIDSLNNTIHIQMNLTLEKITETKKGLDLILQLLENDSLIIQPDSMIIVLRDSVR